MPTETSTASSIERVGVVGAGLMGSGIAEVFARSGLDVRVGELDSSAVERGHQRLRQSLERARRSGKLTDQDVVDTVGRIDFTTDLADFADRQLVVEAVVEREDEKTQVFSHLDKVVENPDAILASNTSSIPIMKLASATSRPANVLGMHFFNPAPVLPLVELVRTLTTSQNVVQRSAAFLSGLHKVVIHAKDRAGFVVNALLVPYILSAIRMFESGFATAEDIDSGMVKGCNHPMGPLRLADLIGLDTLQAVAESMYREFRDPTCAPPALLSRMVEARLLGRKTRSGFYDYS